MTNIGRNARQLHKTCTNLNPDQVKQVIVAKVQGEIGLQRAEDIHLVIEDSFHLIGGHMTDNIQGRDILERAHPIMS